MGKRFLACIQYVSLKGLLRKILSERLNYFYAYFGESTVWIIRCCLHLYVNNF